MILLIDDDPRFLKEAEQVLGAAGHRVLVASSGNQAMQLMAAVGGDVRLIMVDLDLPEISGIEVIQLLRKAFPDLPVVAFSGVVQSNVLEIAKYLGADEALRKPITREWITLVAKAAKAGT